MMKTIISLSACAGVLALLSGCGTTEEASTTLATSKHDSAPLAASAVLTPASGSKVQGVVNFLQELGQIRVEAHITGLTPGEHGFHIHETGDCSAPDASSAGGHFNPTDMAHGGPMSHNRHVGDFGNLKANASGEAHYSKVIPNLKVGGTTSIIGKAVIIHEKADDLKTQPTGDAGGRVACGVIEKK
jgi:Cu-Zn family superoxide dismutase